jgi:hypothetical protein
LFLQGFSEFPCRSRKIRDNNLPHGAGAKSPATWPAKARAMSDTDPGELEEKPRDYLRNLNQAIEQRDRLALDAAWGVLQSVGSSVAFVAVLLAAYKWAPDT